MSSFLIILSGFIVVVGAVLVIARSRGANTGVSSRPPLKQNYPLWIFVAAAVVLVIGIVLLVNGY